MSLSRVVGWLAQTVTTPPAMPAPPKIPDLRLPRGVRMVPGLQASIDAAVASWQPQVQAFCGALWKGAFLAGVERGLMYGLAIGVIVGFAIHRSLIKSLSDAKTITRP